MKLKDQFLQFETINYLHFTRFVIIRYQSL